MILYIETQKSIYKKAVVSSIYNGTMIRIEIENEKDLFVQNPNIHIRISHIAIEGFVESESNHMIFDCYPSKPRSK